MIKNTETRLETAAKNHQKTETHLERSQKITKRLKRTSKRPQKITKRVRRPSKRPQNHQGAETPIRRSTESNLEGLPIRPQYR